MRALVTGSTGFLGSHLVRELRSRGWELVCVARRMVSCDDPGIRCLTADLLTPASLDLEFPKVGHIDAVFHFGALMPRSVRDDKAAFIEANGAATFRLLDLAARLEAEVFVYASGVSVIGEPRYLPINEDHPTAPLHPYIVGKLCGELACEMVRRLEGRRITSLRITSPYGAGLMSGGVLPRFVQQALKSENLVWYGTGNRTQDFVHVSDVVDACLRAVASRSSGIYNIASAQPVSMKDLAGTIINLIPESRSNALPAGLPDPQERIHWQVNIGKAERELGYRPKVQFKDGLAEYIEFVHAGKGFDRWWS